MTSATPTDAVSYDAASTDPHLDRLFAALSHPTRRAIVRRLTAGEVPVNELARPFNMSLPAVSKHLTVLEEAGVIHRVRRGRSRYCTLRPKALDEVSQWLESCRSFWEESLDSLEAYVEDSP